MSSLPCRNPSCSSHGQPHPNCRCYEGYAEGGSVAHYCSSNRAHCSDCKLFAKGGEVSDADVVDHALAQTGGLRILAGGQHSGFAGIDDYLKQAHRGRKRIESHLKQLFDSGDKYEHKDRAPIREKLKKYLEAGGLTTQLAQPTTPEDGFAAENPAAAAALGKTKGDVYSYLNNKRPAPIQGLAFDRPMLNADGDRTYNRALDVAADPLHVLGHVQNGTILPEHVTHLKSMFPSLHDHLSKKITEKLTKLQLAKERPSHTKRQGLSLFLGTNLDSTLTPQSLQAAQATFQTAGGMPPGAHQGGGNRGGSQAKSRAGEKIAAAYQTGGQAAAERKLQDK